MDVGVQAGPLPSHTVIAAGQGGQGHDRPVVLHAVFVVGQGRAGLVDGQRPVLVDQPAGGQGLLVGHAGQRFQIVRVKLPDVLRERLKT